MLICPWENLMPNHSMTLKTSYPSRYPHTWWVAWSYLLRIEFVFEDGCVLAMQRLHLIWVRLRANSKLKLKRERDKTKQTLPKDIPVIVLLSLNDLFLEAMVCEEYTSEIFFWRYTLTGRICISDRKQDSSTVLVSHLSDIFNWLSKKKSMLLQWYQS